MHNPFSLDGSVALVTGARGGIGRAICEALKAAGAHVVGGVRRDPPGDLKIDSWVVHDVTSADDWSRVVADIHRKYGRLDCLINNAGTSLVQSISSMSIEQLRYLMRVNFESVVLGVQASLPLLRASGANRAGGASIVNMSSVAGFRGIALNSAYCCSKAALDLFSRSAAKEFAFLGYPIRVNIVHPARTETTMNKSIFSRYQELDEAQATEAQIARDALKATTPMNRMARPQEVADAVVYLCSSASSYVTGSGVIVDGGLAA